MRQPPSQQVRANGFIAKASQWDVCVLHKSICVGRNTPTCYIACSAASLPLSFTSSFAHAKRALCEVHGLSSQPRMQKLARRGPWLSYRSMPACHLSLGHLIVCYMRERERVTPLRCMHCRATEVASLVSWADILVCVLASGEKETQQDFLAFTLWWMRNKEWRGEQRHTQLEG